jgi:ribonuclease VapC
MVIDTSALIAILFREPEADALVEAILRDSRRYLGAATYVETVAVTCVRRGPEGVVALDALLHELGIEMVSVSGDAGRIAADAYCRYGNGIGSPGVLNFGDCLSYGVAMAAGEPLLYKGDDFSRTDVVAAG